MGKKVSNCISDLDGNKYNGIQIENQLWIIENLNVSKYRNGDDIPHVQNEDEWKNLTTGAWCYYDNDKNYGDTYGKLYNWYAINDPRGLAPEGYHIPSHEEWDILMANLGGDFGAGGKMKEKGNLHWNAANDKANNQSGFTALPGGFRWPEDGFSEIGVTCSFWSSSERNSELAQNRSLSVNHKRVILNFDDKRKGSSVRLVQDTFQQTSGFKLGKLEIFNSDIGELSHNDAKLACMKLGDGWRLPSKLELNTIYENKKLINGLTEAFYWSSDNADGIIGSAWGQNFSDGFQNTCSTAIKYKNFTRPVRDVKN